MRGHGERCSLLSCTGQALVDIWLTCARQVLKFGGREVTIEALWQAVVQAGGYEEVNKVKGWSAIGRGLGAPQCVPPPFAMHICDFERHSADCVTHCIADGV